MVACFCERDDDVPELVGCFWEAVDEEDGAFGFGGGGEAFGVEDADFGVGLLDPGLAVAWFRGGAGCHCRQIRKRMIVQRMVKTSVYRWLSSYCLRAPLFMA